MRYNGGQDVCLRDPRGFQAGSSGDFPDGPPENGEVSTDSQRVPGQDESLPELDCPYGIVDERPPLCLVTSEGDLGCYLNKEPDLTGIPVLDIAVLGVAKRVLCNLWVDGVTVSRVLTAPTQGPGPSERVASITVGINEVPEVGGAPIMSRVNVDVGGLSPVRVWEPYRSCVSPVCQPEDFPEGPGASGDSGVDGSGEGRPEVLEAVLHNESVPQGGPSGDHQEIGEAQEGGTDLRGVHGLEDGGPQGSSAGPRSGSRTYGPEEMRRVRDALIFVMAQRMGAWAYIRNVGMWLELQDACTDALKGRHLAETEEVVEKIIDRWMAEQKT